MFHVVLVEPDIPQNTGNIIRLCANTGAQLHLIEPLGFPMDHAKMRRAGLDYHEYATVQAHRDWPSFLASHKPDPGRVFFFSSHASGAFAEANFLPGDVLVFGSETKGLDALICGQFPDSQRIRLPMRPANRSLNLSNAVAVVVYEAWRQNRFEGSA